MALQRTYGVTSWVTLVVILNVLFLTGCSTFREPEIKVVTQIEKTTVPTVARPKPIDLVDTRVYVVTAENYDSFVEEFKAEHGELAYVVLSMKDYENLAINIADLRRYIEQQTEIIVYYEEAVKPNTDTDTNK